MMLVTCSGSSHRHDSPSTCKMLPQLPLIQVELLAATRQLRLAISAGSAIMKEKKISRRFAADDRALHKAPENTPTKGCFQTAKMQCKLHLHIAILLRLVELLQNTAVECRRALVWRRSKRGTSDNDPDPGANLGVFRARTLLQNKIDMQKRPYTGASRSTRAPFQLPCKFGRV